MRIAVLGDIHGNWTALEKVAEDLAQRDVDVILGLGDYLHTSLGSAKVVEWMKRQLHAYFVLGDNDRWENYERFGPLAREDPYAQYQYVNQLPDRIVLEFQGVTLLTQHGYPWRTPIQERGWSFDVLREVLSRPYVESVVDLRGIDIACFGEMHVPYVDIHEDVVIAHPGSVGIPLDREAWAAKYLLLDFDRSGVQFTHHKVPFSREAAAQEARHAFREDPGDNHALARLLARAPNVDWDFTPFDFLWRRQ